MNGWLTLPAPVSALQIDNQLVKLSTISDNSRSVNVEFAGLKKKGRQLHLHVISAGHEVVQAKSGLTHAYSQTSVTVKRREL